MGWRRLPVVSNIVKGEHSRAWTIGGQRGQTNIVAGMSGVENNLNMTQDS